MLCAALDFAVVVCVPVMVVVTTCSPGVSPEVISTSVSLERPVVTGTRVGGRCVTRHGRGDKHAPRCTLLLAVARLTRVDSPGANRVRLTGRFAGKALPPGRYALQAVATASGLTSRRVSARFQILP